MIASIGWLRGVRDQPRGLSRLRPQAGMARRLMLLADGLVGLILFGGLLLTLLLLT